MFRFEHPQHLYLLLALPLLWVLLLAWRQWQRKAIGQLGQIDQVYQGISTARFWIKGALFSLVLVLLSVAWANPQRGARMQTVAQSSSDIFILLDISQSMLCADIQPNRLKIAQIFAEKLVKSLEGERIGLIFFAGNAYLQMPLSTDYGFILQQIREASTDLITEQGTAIPAAINLAVKAFEEAPGGGRGIVLITDGENHDEDAVAAAERAYEDGIVVYAVGAGTEEGGPIPFAGPGQYKRDESNNIVRTKMDEQLLRKLAMAGGGKSLLSSSGDRAVSALQKELAGLEKRELSVRSYAEYESWFQWFLLPALLLLLLESLLSWRAVRRTHA